MTYIELMSELARIRASRYSLKYGVRFLSLDWDAWTGDRWSHKCCGFCYKPVNPIGRGRQKNTDDVRVDWMSPITNFPTIGTPIVTIVSECHADMAYLISQADYVINIDAHRDTEDYNELCCGSWACGLQNYKHFEYPITGYEYINESIFKPDIVYMCLSSPWTPKNTDSLFFEFAKHIASKCTINTPLFFGHKKSSLKTKYHNLLKKGMI